MPIDIKERFVQEPEFLALKEELNQLRQQLPVFDSGYLEIRDTPMEYKKNHLSLRISIDFNKTFSKTPELFFSPVLIDIGTDDDTTRYEIKIIQISSTKFECEIRTWLKTTIWNLKFKWLAIQY